VIICTLSNRSVYVQTNIKPGWSILQADSQATARRLPSAATRSRCRNISPEPSSAAKSATARIPQHTELTRTSLHLNQFFHVHDKISHQLTSVRSDELTIILREINRLWSEELITRIAKIFCIQAFNLNYTYGVLLSHLWSAVVRHKANDDVV